MDNAAGRSALHPWQFAECWARLPYISCLTADYGTSKRKFLEIELFVTELPEFPRGLATWKVFPCAKVGSSVNQ